MLIRESINLDNSIIAKDWNGIYSLFLSGEELKIELDKWRNNINELENKNKTIIKGYSGSYESLESILDECADWSVKNSSNDMFALFIMDYIKSYNEKIYNPFIDSITKGMDGQKLIKSIKFMTSKAWNNPNVDYSPGDKSLFYKNDGRITMDLMGADYPVKELIIQSAFVLGLDSKTTNQWLKIAGRDMLYPLDIVDLVCRFYLDFYSNYKNDSKSGEEKLKNVKSKINYYLNLMIDSSLDDQTDWNIKLKKMEGGIYFEDKESISDYDWRKKEWSYNKKLKTIKQKLFEEKATDNSLTKYIDGKLLGSKAIKEEDEFDKIIKDNIDLFRQVHYSLTEKNIEYISAVEKTKKNLYFYSDEPIYKGDEFSKKMGGYAHVHAISDEKMNPDSLDQVNTIKKKLTTFLNIANSVLSSKNVLEKEYFVFNNRKGNSSNALRNKILGRGEEINGDKGYYLEKFNLVGAAKYCIGTGNEEEIGEYMRLSGYWDYDISDKYKRENNKDSLSPITPCDMYLIYLFKLRDKILEDWYSDYRDKEKESWLNNAREEFPLVALSALITRDIQLVNKIRNKSYSDKYAKIIRSFIPFYMEKSDMELFED